VRNAVQRGSTPGIIEQGGREASPSVPDLECHACFRGSEGVRHQCMRIGGVQPVEDRLICNLA
jgi:hypothetical protein